MIGMSRGNQRGLSGPPGAPAAAFPSTAQHPLAAPRFYQLGRQSGAGQPVINLTTGLLHVVPFVVARDCTVSELFVHVTAGVTAHIRYGIYAAADAPNLDPTTLLFGSADFVNVGTKKTVGLALKLTAGTIYWAAFLAGTAQPTVRGAGQGEGWSGPMGDTEARHTDGVSALSSAFTVAQAFGALPDPCPPLTSVIQTIAPSLFARFSA
jgi:hypothetical protein